MASIKLRGSVYYSWFVHDKKRIHRSLGTGNERLAWKRLWKLVEEVEADSGTWEGDISWKAFKRAYTDKVLKRPNTHRIDRAAFKMMEDRIKVAFLSEITPQTLQDLAYTRVKEGRKPSTIKREFGALKRAMRWSEREFKRPAQDWKGIEIPRVPKKIPHSHTKDELAKLFKVCKGQWLTMAWLGARAGLRRGEIRELQPQHVRFAEKYIQVRGPHIKDSDERDILLLDDLAEYLASLPLHKRKYVIGDDRPSLMQMTKEFLSLTKEAGLTGGLQTLRHTYISILANDENVNIYQLMEWAGHSDVRITLSYRSPSTRARADSAVKIARLFA